MFFHMTSPVAHNGAAIRAFRVKAGRKPGEFAKAAGTSYSHLDNIENERKQPSLELLNRIAYVLEVPVAALVRDPAAVTASRLGAA